MIFHSKSAYLNVLTFVQHHLLLDMKTCALIVLFLALYLAGANPVPKFDRWNPAWGEKKPGVSTTCRECCDKNDNCAQMVSRGFCNYYDKQAIFLRCAKSCGMCHSFQAPQTFFNYPPRYPADKEQ
ncbi:hypothetical protein L596_024954 [Steinernema carpocapsae]|uniref:ShKT domain-containing protein n=1 Tax=Steinernema carpocapsae TaxID=34508 RepID=A0A4U5M6C4_STECR|nr:hypothetical protein L596_024954 [Steinernema carpocapsae]